MVHSLSPADALFSPSDPMCCPVKC
uniref:Uncharacterized protein n=1 Tax=Rhizophora mucronata TaxID=61149 RepID=A0A2P2P8J0_RHIMU